MFACFKNKLVVTCITTVPTRLISAEQGKISAT